MEPRDQYHPVADQQAADGCASEVEESRLNPEVYLSTRITGDPTCRPRIEF